MFEPTRRQRLVLLGVALLLVFCWPPDRGPNLLFRTMHWVVDPTDSLPTLPPTLPPGLGDDGDAVAAHDAIEAEYYRLYNSSPITRWRMDMKVKKDPFEPEYERQILVASVALAAFMYWLYGKDATSST
jgi:hypothetical protein